MDFNLVERLLNQLDLADPEVASIQDEVGMNVDGTVCLRNGEVLVTNPVGTGGPAAIMPSDNVAIFVNGDLVSRVTPVREDDEIEIYPQNQPAEKLINLSISDSELSARLKVSYVPEITYDIPDTIPQKSLAVRTIPHISENIEKYSVEELFDYLRQHGVTFGIDIDAVKRLAENGGDAIVAKGTPPIPGSDAQIDLLFETEVFRFRMKDDEDMRIDLLDQFEITQVSAEQLLATKTPAAPGVEGRTIMDKPIIPPTPRDTGLVTGEGAAVTSDGLRVIATKGGLPQLKNNVISVLPFYTHDGDLNPKHGHLSFNGHIIIKGDLTGGVKLNASGDVMIWGGVTNSEIVAGGNVTVKKSIISSDIKAGGLDAATSSLVNKLNILSNEIGLLSNAVNQVITNPSFLQQNRDNKVIGPLVSLLLENKFPSISRTFEELIEICGNTSHEDCLSLLKTCFKKFTFPKITHLKGLQQLRAVEGLLASKAADLEKSINSPAHLRLSYAQNSQLQASGKIECIGKGCYGCELYAGQDVAVVGKEGYFRGDKIVAGGNVDIVDLGNPAGTETIVEFPQKSILRADIVHNNVLIRSGRQSSRITDDKRLLKCWVDHKANLNVSALKLDLEDKRKA